MLVIRSQWFAVYRAQSWEEQGENAIVILGLDAVRIEFYRQRQRAVEFASGTFAR